MVHLTAALPPDRYLTLTECRPAGLSVVLVIMYGLRPFLVSGQKHMPSPLLGPQKVVGVVTIAAGWTSLFLGCVVIHQNWVSAGAAKQLLA